MNNFKHLHLVFCITFGFIDMAGREEHPYKLILCIKQYHQLLHGAALMPQSKFKTNVNIKSQSHVQK